MQPRKFLISLAIAMTILSLSQRSRPQEDWHEPYTDAKTLGGALEARFQNLLSNCGAYPLRKNTTGLLGRPKEGPNISSVPSSVQTNFPTGEDILPAIPHSTGQLFAYVYRPNEMTGPFEFDQSRLISNANYTQDPASMLLQGGISTVYTNTCAAVVNAAASIKGGWSIPLASATAALSSEYSSSVKSAIALTQGSFHSPLYALWSSPDANQQLFAGFLFWQWYVNHPEAVGQQNFYLTDFPGVSLYSLVTSQNQSSIDLSGSAGVTSPFVSLDSTLKANLTEQTSINSNDNYTYIKSASNHGDKWGNFNPLPGPQEIANVGLATTTQRSASSSTIAKGQVFQYTQSATGIPSAFCTRSQWVTDYQDSAGQLSIASVVPGTDPSLEPTCTFTMLFGPSDSLFGANASPQVIQIAYHLKLRSALGGVSLALNTAALRLSTSISPVLASSSGNSPRWTVNSENIVPNTNAHDYSLSWKVKYQVIDADDPVDNVDSNVQLTMSCPSVAGTVVQQQPPTSAQYDSAAKIVTVSIREDLYNVPSTINADDVSSFITCTASGTVDFQMANPPGGGREIPKAIGEGISLEFPAPKPQQPQPGPAPAQQPIQVSGQGVLMVNPRP